MLVRSLVLFTFLAGLTVPAAAQERVTIGTQRLADNGALFLAVARGYFKAEGLDVEMTAYKSDKEVAQAVAAGAVDFGLAAYSTDAFNYAGEGFFKFVASQVQERKGVEGNEVVASNAAWANGLRKMENLKGKSVAITYLGSPYHYQLAQIAKAKNFNFGDIVIKTMQTVDAAALAVAEGKAEAAILPANYARELMVASQARLVGWYSEVGDEQQLGALFVSTKTLGARRPVVDKFVRAYRHGATDYSGMVQLDRYGKRISNVGTREIATVIARYVYPGRQLGRAAATVETGAYPMDAKAKLDVADIERQVAWFKSQKLIEDAVDPRNIVDTSLGNEP
ncbi:MAG: ABC transporter substrate-binding protein [Pseudolabrys sp.]